MTKLVWDKVGERFYETGVDHGVLYLPDTAGNYDTGFEWNGLVSVTESPSGAEATPQYADNIKYLNLVSAEEYGGSIEAFTFPDEFAQCDGSAELSPGISIGQQNRSTFGMSYRTRKGNDIALADYGYKLNLVYGALAAPTEKAHTTINDSPEAITFSWEFSTTPIEVGTIAGKDYKPTAVLTIDSTKVDKDKLTELEDLLYGTAGTDPRLPTPAEVYALFSGTITEVMPTAPAYDPATKTITIPTVIGVIYSINDEDLAAGPVVITEDTLVTSRPAPGYVFADPSDSDWFYDFTA